MSAQGYEARLEIKMSPTTKKWLMIGGALLALSAYGNAESDHAPASPATPAAPVATVLDPTTQAAVSRLAVLARTNPQAARKLAPLYSAAAEVTRDPDLVSNTQAWQDASDKAQVTYATLSGVAGSIPGWSDAYTAVRVSVLGSENRAIDADMRAKWASALLAIAQACEGA